MTHFDWTSESSTSASLQFEFPSKNLGKTISSKDLETLDKQSLIELDIEVDYVASSILARVEWSKTSQPSEWPDEDWPRRVLAALVFHQKFLKRIRKNLFRKREEEQMEKQLAVWEAKKEAYRLKRQACRMDQSKKEVIQERHNLHQERLAKLNYLKTRYVFQILSEKCGKPFADQVFEEAKALANSNVDSATWTD
jgi:hypothetical protein